MTTQTPLRSLNVALVLDLLLRRATREEGATQNARATQNERGVRP